ncbi:MAG TPA: AAA family ATPase [Polyangia bacterium]|nr:AAA family ATPase [Polyangia bacterium]
MQLHLPFPRSTSAFVGRKDELQRVGELLGTEALFLVYGIAGIGKSEFVYKAIEEAQKTPRFRSAPPILLQARADQRTEHLLSILRLRLSNTKTGQRGACDKAPSFDEDLVEVARLLETRAFLIFLDDAQHLDPAFSVMLGYLGRHVRRSRLFVASRAELTLPADTPMPVFVRLQPLDVGASAALVAALSHRMGIGGADPTEVFHRSGGSPFLIQRELARLRCPSDSDGPSGDPTRDWMFTELSREARQVLLLARALRGRLTLQDLEQQGLATDPLRELVRRFLIDVDRGVIIVHDLIWDALRPLLPEADVAWARRTAAELLLRRFAIDPHRNAADAIEAIQRLIGADELERAFETLHTAYSAIAGAGLDHLLLELLPALRRGPAQHRLAVDLLAVRTHLRRSHIAQAQEILDALGREPEARGSPRYLRLAGEVRQRSGKLDEARALLEQAQAAAHTPRERFYAQLQLANVSSFDGQCDAARKILDQARAELGTLAPIDAARWGWSLALSYVLEDRMEDAAGAAAETTAAFGPRGPGDADAVVLLAMHEVVARVECDEVGRARAQLDRILHHTAASGSLREQIAAVYRGVVLFAEGDMPGARITLEEALSTLEAHQDYTPASAAAYYLGRTQLALGDLDGAAATAQRALRLAQAAGLRGLTPHGLVLQAQILLAASQPAAARMHALRVLETSPTSRRIRAAACAVLAKSHALHRDLPAAWHALQQAADCVTVTPACAREHDVEYAEFALLYGAGSAQMPEFQTEPLDQIIRRTEGAVAHYATSGRRHLEARAALALAAGLLCRGGAEDLQQADELLGRAQDLCTRHAYGLLHLRGLLLEAALAQRQGRERHTKTVLAQGLDSALPVGDSLELRLLRAAAPSAGQNAGDDAVAQGVLALLGLGGAETYEIIDRHGRRDADEAACRRAFGMHDLIIELERGAISRGGGGGAITGRPLMATLLVALLTAPEDGMSAERLFYDVWGGKQYNPLRHRNTIHVAIARLRQALRELVPGRDVVETTPQGWRLAREVDLCAIGPKKSPDRAPQRG